MRLGDVCEVVMGQSPSSDSYNGDGEGFPFYQGNADFGLVHPNPSTWCTAPKKLADPGDLLLSVRAPIGAVNVANERCCIGRGVAALRHDRELVDSGFLRIQLEVRRSYLESLGTGSTFKAVGKKSLETFPLIVYPKECQIAIVERFEVVSEYLNAARRQLSLLDDLVKSRFVEMFGDPRSNDRGWVVRPLGEACSTRLGKMLDVKKQDGKNQRPYLANTDVQWFSFNLNNLRTMDFDESDREEFALKEGDVLATEGGEVGRCAIWHGELEECYFQKAVHRIRCNGDCLVPEFLAWTFKMKSELGLFDPYVSRSTIAHLTGKKIKQVPVQLPPLALQREFADFAECVAKSRVVVRQQVEKLQTLYDSLAQDYFG